MLIAPNVDFFSSALLRGLSPDTVIQVGYKDDFDVLREESVVAHMAILAKSPYFLRLLVQQAATAGATPYGFLLRLDLSMVRNALASLRAFLTCLYTGQLDISAESAEGLILLARLCELPSLEAQVRAQISALYANLFASVLSTPSQSALFSSPTQKTGDHQAHFAGFDAFSAALTPPESVREESERSRTSSVSSSSSSAISVEASSPHLSHTQEINPNVKHTDVMVPSFEKEGWCRNKKYIETLPGKGYRCTVCQKTYGRYNSVSYHVTIYHRQPPIKCDEPGCGFTTREARYIHFHKFYKHGHALPDSIDIGTRRCRFPSCSHVSKSPAMLEKHIARHAEGVNVNEASVSSQPKRGRRRASE
ncbi:Protein F10B5.3 [Aphelenchoides avenae]|nr:Protein F10B5.3 [Aphelenchus avenae]